MRRILIAAAAVGLVLGGLAIARAEIQQHRNESTARRLDEALAREWRATTAPRALRLAELADFDWHLAHVFDGAAKAAHIEERLGREWDEADDVDYERCDPPPLWVFVDEDGEPVRWFRRTDIGGLYDDCVDTERPLDRDARLAVDREQPAVVSLRAGETVEAAIERC